MDFKDWQKLEEDDKTCTLQHPKGHVMKIAMKALPKIQQEQIKRLKFAKGGDVLESGEKEGVSTQGEAVRHHAKRKNPEDMKQAKAEAKGRAEFERVASKPKLKGLADGGEVANEEPAKSEDATPPAAAPNPTTINIMTPAQAPAAAAPAIAAPVPPPTSPAVEYAKQPVQVRQPVIPQGRPNLNPDGQPNPSAMMENAQTAVKAQSDIDAAKAQAMEPVVAGYQQGSAETEQIAQKRLADYEKHVNDAAKAINEGLINPKHYQESMSSGAKASTAIGLFLGGFGTPFGGTNYAMDFLNKQIDRDIDAQKSRSDQQKTILGAYEHLYGQGVAATNATKATLLDAYKNKVDQIAVQLGTPQAAQKALQFGNEAAIQKMKLIQEGATDFRSIPGNRPAISGNAGAAKPMRPGGQPAPAPSGGGASAAIPKKEAGPLHETILSPNAEAAFKAARYNPATRDQYAKLEEQYNQAKQADTALAHVNQAFQDILQTTTEGGSLGRFHRKFDPKAIGGIGDNFVSGIANVIGHGAQAMTDTDNARRYDSQKTALLGILSGAFRGTNITGGQLQEIVDQNAPEYGDSVKSAAIKLRNIRDFINQHTQRNLLDLAGMSIGKKSQK